MANQTKTRFKGGLVLKKEELKKILKKPKTEGIAFTLHNPGQAYNVDLKVYRVFGNGNLLQGEEVECKFKKGASGVLRYPNGKVDDFEFHLLKKIEEDKFFFGFIPKQKFKLFFEVGMDEVYICAGEQKYVDTTILEKDQESWFTFTMYVRESINKKFVKDVEELKRKWKGNNLVEVSDLGSEKIITLGDLEKDLGEDACCGLIVDTIMVEKHTNYIKGILFKDDGKKKRMLFNDNHQVKSILLRTDGSVSKIYKEEEIDDASLDDFEELILGGYPDVIHMVGCPPHWSAPRVEYKNSLEEAILGLVNS